MKTMAIIAASLIGAATLASGASAASSHDKQVRWQKEEQARTANSERMSSRPTTTTRSTYGAPARQTFGAADTAKDAASEPAAAPRALSMPGSGAPIYHYDDANTNRAYGY